MKRITILGNLVEDVELKKAGGKTVANIRVACEGKGGKDDVAFIPVTVWEKQAENLQKYCGTKGSKVYIEADVDNNNYEDKDGKKQYGFRFTAISIEYVGTKKD